jgi:hypothetical protein
MESYIKRGLEIHESPRLLDPKFTVQFSALADFVNASNEERKTASPRRPSRRRTSSQKAAHCWPPAASELGAWLTPEDIKNLRLRNTCEINAEDQYDWPGDVPEETEMLNCSCCNAAVHPIHFASSHQQIVCGECYGRRHMIMPILKRNWTVNFVLDVSREGAPCHGYSLNPFLLLFAIRFSSILRPRRQRQKDVRRQKRTRLRRFRLCSASSSTCWVWTFGELTQHVRKPIDKLRSKREYFSQKERRSY